MTLSRIVGAGALVSFLGCASTPPPLPEPPVIARAATPVKPITSSPIVLTSAELPEAASSVPIPDTNFEEQLPIDLPTVLRLVDANNPAIGFARAKVSEAQARLDKAELQWIPNLSVGAAYNHFDGQTQNQRGEVFGTSRGNLFAGGGIALGLDFAEAIYRPLIERQRKAGDDFRYQSAILGSELDAVIAYLDLVQVHAQIAINADTLEKAQSMHKAAKDAQAAKLDRTAGDVQRAQTEVLFREQERIDLEGRAGAASARLGRFLLIPETVKLLPADAAVAPVTLIDAGQSLKSLVALGVQNHPQLAANRAELTAAWERVALAKKAAILPKLAVVDQVGGFGGGFNDDLQNFDARNALGVQLFWELRNFGLGNQADIAQHRAVVDQRNYQLLDSQARLVAEIVDAAQIAKAKANSLAIAEQAVKEATELYRIAKEGTFNVIDAKNLFDALRPLQAIQTLNQARLNYLATVIDYNRAQYRLFTALGHAPQCAVAR
ncbi:TolC family protein [soil metagenome]